MTTATAIPMATNGNCANTFAFERKGVLTIVPAFGVFGSALTAYTCPTLLRRGWPTVCWEYLPRNLHRISVALPRAQGLGIIWSSTPVSPPVVAPHTLASLLPAWMTNIYKRRPRRLGGGRKEGRVGKPITGNPGLQDAGRG